MPLRGEHRDTRNVLPPALEAIRRAARKAIGEIRLVGEGGKDSETCWFHGERTEAGRSVPPYYLIYFLFVELLEFPDLGRSEKVAWSVPIDYKGKVFIIEHRK